MPTKVTMPQMGESIFEGTITKWLKKVGEKVGRDEPLLEISTDKVDSEIPSPAAGVLKEILADEGQTVQVNSVVAVIEAEGAAEADKAAPEPAAPPEAAPPEAERQAAPAVEEAAPPAREAPPAEPEPAPAAEVPAEAPAEAAEEAPAEAAEEAPAEEALEPPKAPPVEAAEIPVEKPPEKEPEPAAAGKPEAPKIPEEKEERPPAAPAAQPRDIRTSPLVRRLAREYNVDLAEIKGSGLSGRITKDDVMSFVEARDKAAAPKPPAAPAPAVEAKPEPPKPERPAVPAAPPPAAPEPSRPAAPPKPPQPAPPQAAPPEKKPAAPEVPRFYGESETVPMTPMRKAIAEHMVRSKHTSAHVHTVFEVDMTAIVRLREKHKDEFEAREGIKLTFTPFFVKALIDAVREFPVVNSSVSDDTIVYKKPINVGVAVALETGLIVPVVKNAHLKSFTGLALAINDLADRARNKRLKPDDVQQGTVSITNPGIYGSLFGTPVINQPQVAILGVGGIEKRPVVIDDAIAIRSMVYLALSFDHRVIDGAVADQFMAALKRRLETWTQWVE